MSCIRRPSTSRRLSDSLEPLTKRPRIKRTTQRVKTADGDLYLLRPSAGRDVHIERPSEEDRRLLESLDGRSTRAKLAGSFGEEAVERPLPAPSARVARLAAFNSTMRIEVCERRLDSEVAVSEAIAGSDVVIDAVDWPALDIERWVNSACFGAGIPFVAMSHFPPVARIGPFYVPGEIGCYACQEISYRQQIGSAAALALPQRT